MSVFPYKATAQQLGMVINWLEQIIVSDRMGGFLKWKTGLVSPFYTGCQINICPAWS